MKRILSILGIVGLTATTSSSVISCSGNTSFYNKHAIKDIKGLLNKYYDYSGPIEFSNIIINPMYIIIIAKNSNYLGKGWFSFKTSWGSTHYEFDYYAVIFMMPEINGGNSKNSFSIYIDKENYNKIA